MILTDKHFVHSPISTHDCSNGRTKPTVLLTALCSSQENTQFYYVELICLDNAGPLVRVIKTGNCSI